MIMGVVGMLPAVATLRTRTCTTTRVRTSKHVDTPSRMWDILEVMMVPLEIDVKEPSWKREGKRGKYAVRTLHKTYANTSPFNWYHRYIVTTWCLP